MNINGFGDRENRIVSTLAPFGGQLYAGTYNTGASGAQIWRSGDGMSWTPVITNGFGSTRNIAIPHLLEFNGQLYASTWSDSATGAQIWRTSDGINWTRVVSAGFGDPTDAEIHRLAVFNGQVYASAWSFTSTHGTEIWRSSTGDSGDWTRVVSNGFDADVNNPAATAMAVFNNSIYAATVNRTTGTEVWRSSTGNSGDWTQVNLDGFGEGASNNAMTSLAAVNGNLYAGTGNCTTGAEVWQAPDGSSWTKVVDAGFGDKNNCSMENLFAFNGNLFVTTANAQIGMEVWRSVEGTRWTQSNPAGFGDSNTQSGYWGNAITVFNGRLYFGTNNFGTGGGKIWQMLQQVYLPAILR